MKKYKFVAHPGLLFGACILTFGFLLYLCIFVYFYIIYKDFSLIYAIVIMAFCCSAFIIWGLKLCCIIEFVDNVITLKWFKKVIRQINVTNISEVYNIISRGNFFVIIDDLVKPKKYNMFSNKKKYFIAFEETKKSLYFVLEILNIKYREISAREYGKLNKQINR